jgi:hypothetical protein
MTVLKFLKFLGAISFLLVLSGCKPEEILLNVYSTDVAAAADGELVQVPLTAKFSLLGDDDDKTLERAVEITKRFLHKDTKFTRSKTDYSEVLVVETFIPMGKTSELLNFFSNAAALAYLELLENKEKNDFEITLLGSQNIEELNRALKGLNLMLGFELPATNTTIRVISDSRKNVWVGADAVFISEKPYLYFEADLKRRDEVNVVYKGGADSIWSGVAPVFYIRP